MIRTIGAILLTALLAVGCSTEVSGPNRAPHAEAGFDRTTEVGQPVLLDGSKSWDPDGDLINHAWDLVAAPAGASISALTTHGETATLDPAVSGVWLVRLIVTDGKLDSTDIVQVRVMESCTDEGPYGDPTCTDGLDNDCDDVSDGEDTDCWCTADNDCDAGQLCRLIDGVCVDDLCDPNPCNGHGTCDDSTGQAVCTCDEGYALPTCNACIEGYIGYPDCVVDLCYQVDCHYGTCNGQNGQCECETGYNPGNNCADCLPGFHQEGNVCVANQCEIDDDCDSGLFCDGAETCGASHTCQSGPVPCSGQLCREADDTCVNCLFNSDCSNGVFCDGVETCNASGNCQNGSDSCPGQMCREVDDQCVECLADSDCDDSLTCTGVETCSNGVCQDGVTETCSSRGVCQEPAATCLCDEGYAGALCNTCDTGYHDENGECVPDWPYQSRLVPALTGGETPSIHNGGESDVLFFSITAQNGPAGISVMTFEVDCPNGQVSEAANEGKLYRSLDGQTYNSITTAGQGAVARYIPDANVIRIGFTQEELFAEGETRYYRLSPVMSGLAPSEQCSVTMLSNAASGPAFLYHPSETSLLSAVDGVCYESPPNFIWSDLAAGADHLRPTVDFWPCALLEGAEPQPWGSDDFIAGAVNAGVVQVTVTAP